MLCAGMLVTIEGKQVGKTSRRLMQAGEMEPSPQEGLMHGAPMHARLDKHVACPHT